MPTDLNIRRLLVYEDGSAKSPADVGVVVQAIREVAPELPEEFTCVDQDFSIGGRIFFVVRIPKRIDLGQLSEALGAHGLSYIDAMWPVQGAEGETHRTSQPADSEPALNNGSVDSQTAKDQWRGKNS